MLAGPIQLLDEFGDDFCYQDFESFVVVILLPVKFTVTLDYPSHIAGAMLADDVRRRRWSRRVKNRLDVADRRQEFLPLSRREAREHGSHFLAGPAFERIENAVALGCEGKELTAAVLAGGSGFDPAVLLKVLQHTADVTAVEAQVLAEILCGGVLTMRDFVEHADFSQRELAIE